MLYERLSQIDGTLKLCSECKKVVGDAENIIIFGAGVGGKQLFEFLKENNLEHKVRAFSDNNKLKFNNLYCGIKIIPPNILFEEYPMASIIIASSAYIQIKKQLMQIGYSENNIVLFNFAFSDLKYTDKEFIYDNIDEFEDVFSLLCDERSRNIFAYILNYKITKDDKYLQILQEEVDDEVYQYFDFDLYNLRDDDVIVDVGAFTGDTLECLVKFHKRNYKEYLCFEADSNTYIELKKNIKYNKFKNVLTYNLGLWDKKDILKLCIENSGSSMVSDNVEDNKEFQHVNVDTLDRILGDKRVTLIKMDIEGAEFNALCGMNKTIIRNRPILAIAVYHKRDDYYKLLKYIESIIPGEYKYYFRQYRYTPTETICYAIPRCRVNK